MKPIAERSAAPTRARELVLYVEDDPDNREVARLRLERDYDLLFAATDREACEIIKSREKELAAVLMDIQLQGSQLDGIRLTRLIKGLPVGTLPGYAVDVPVIAAPVIFVTAYGGRYERELKSAGAAKVIPKPVDFVELSLAITQHHLDTVSRRINR